MWCGANRKVGGHRRAKRPGIQKMDHSGSDHHHQLETWTGNLRAY